MFTVESIKKVVNLMNKTRKTFEKMPVENIPLCISTGNNKIGKTLNVSLPPILTCANCKECKMYCYDIKACLQYPNTVINARIRNLVILQKDRNEYFNRIEKRIQRRKLNKAFRWHVAGDIVDYDYFDRMVTIATNHPDWIFWTYTKNYPIVNEWIRNHGETKENLPKNLSVMFSEWKGLPMVNPYNMPVFSVFFDGDELPENAYICPGNCDICLKTGRGCPNKENGFVHDH